MQFSLRKDKGGEGGVSNSKWGTHLFKGLQYCCYYNPILKRLWDVHTILQSILCQHKKCKWTVTYCINASAKKGYIVPQHQSEKHFTVWFYVWSSVIIIHSKKCFQKLCTKVTTFFQIVSAKSTVQEWPLSAGPTSEELLIKSVTISKCGSLALLNICKMKIRAIHLY